MHPLRPFVLWLAAAIAMIAVCVLPSAASAHAGHHGGRADAPSAVHVAADVPAAAVGTHDAASASAVTRTAVTAQVEPRLTCTGRCCVPGCHACSSCCASGLMPAADLSWDGPPPGGAHLARDLPRPAGIVPEALPEPPRPFA